MKKITMLMTICILVVHSLFGLEVTEMHNSRLALDWAGSYSSVLPGADNAGIFIQITLNWDETYEAIYHYIDKSDREYTLSGVFTWDNEGRTITLDTKYIARRYKVGEGFLLQLDIDGNVITGDHAEMYRLRMVSDMD